MLKELRWFKFTFIYVYLHLFISKEKLLRYQKQKKFVHEDSFYFYNQKSEIVDSNFN